MRVICGSVSLPLKAALFSTGVWLIANTCGPIDEVFAALVTGNLTNEVFLMDAGFAVRVIGDAAKPGRIGDAIRSGHDAAMTA